jgi:hypothetical protein
MFQNFANNYLEKSQCGAGFCRDLSMVDNIRFKVSIAVTIKNAVFWDIRTQFVLHR